MQFVQEAVESTIWRGQSARDFDIRQGHSRGGNGLAHRDEMHVRGCRDRILLEDFPARTGGSGGVGQIFRNW